ncbi:ferredoxin--NADP reductase [Fluoribacter dumoffii]|uniref:ferredoxin--NADP reductase n=1 Tax=Fluoribacter dumoffii TaxID=463 RepID=UPI002244D8A1|nr:ferredoxin--NADP reductase [Fluoribacter dumoffii]MCW8386531.1 ferredoxin--NADP reductase [Fluoribacter dumoffii]MCW8419585.1 ferredoxin--NADP reductase [Fluoribacter dumoffii]MCW8455712.1 ferredoxin--NADP reductase [Fluoribacter dumoffii]MCW8460209.1 ferredoxin--NADP reductase [Fluoribacter dumoffii]MCW8483688.1 ferredoxin--NADP reductase [Fluoribacter dumoffii]
MQINTFPITLKESFMISPKVKHFIFSCEATPHFNYLPGQFITIHFEHQGKPLKRSYSIANTPKMDNQIELAAGYFANGPGTEFLYNLKPGDAVQISGPFGRLTIKDEIPGRFILVATSTGITPYRSMIPKLAQLMEQHPELEVVILQGVQRREEILYGDEFLAFSQKYPRASFKPYLSRQPANELNENEFSGYVQHAFPSLNLNPQRDVVYLCGNPGMIDEAFNSLKQQGFAMQQIIREKYISR